MNKNIKKIVLKFIPIIAWPFNVIPDDWRRNILFTFLVIESRIKNPKYALKNLLQLKDKLDLLINERALIYGGGEPPKHILMKYHDYFISNIPNGSNVLDLGCGYGAVARSIAMNVRGVNVTGIENNKERFNQAKLNNNLENLDFIYGDVLEITNNTKCDVIVMSNILEHIDERVKFLRKIKELFTPKIILIRVPLFERSWEIAFRKELGINYFSDSTHYIEHTIEEFRNEMSDASLKIDDMQISWGEIWAKCRP